MQPSDLKKDALQRRRNNGKTKPSQLARGHSRKARAKSRVVGNPEVAKTGNLGGMKNRQCTHRAIR